jgi:hypothetical protein
MVQFLEAGLQKQSEPRRRRADCTHLRGVRQGTHARDSAA